MKKKDGAYTGGVIAVKETKLLKDRLPRFCAMGAEEAFRALLDAGFGGGDAESVSDVEKLVSADDRDIDRFILEYAPSEEILSYLLASRDFYNAKAIVKADFLKTDCAPMAAGDGLFSVKALQKKIGADDLGDMPQELAAAVRNAKSALAEGADGASVGAIFARAEAAFFNRTLKRGACRKLFALRTDMTNLLTAFRSKSTEEAEKYLLEGGSLSKKQLALAFGDAEKIKKAFRGTVYSDFADMLVAAKEEGRPYSEAEKALASCELRYFNEKPFELGDDGVFLRYIFRRRTENANVRIVFTSLAAGLKEGEILRRLRG